MKEREGREDEEVEGLMIEIALLDGLCSSVARQRRWTQRMRRCRKTWMKEVKGRDALKVAIGDRWDMERREWGEDAMRIWNI